MRHVTTRSNQLRSVAFPFRLPHAAFAGALLLAAACGAPAPIAPDPAPAAAGVRPGDLVRIAVWREPDYSGDYPVDAHGQVTLPQVGALSVAGRSPDLVTQTITGAYRKFLDNPSITVTVLTRVTVSGEVNKPGSVLADRTMSVGDLISEAGGFGPLAKRNSIELLRDGRVLVSRLALGTLLLRSPVEPGDQIFVPQSGWFSRNGHYFLTGAISVASAVTAALILRK